MTQQTAVKWLEDRLNNVKPTQFCSIETIKEWVEQAEQMEKEQIAKAWDDGDYSHFYSKETGKDFENGEQYYNEIYGE